MKIFSKNTWGVDVNNAWPLTCKASWSKKNRVTSLDFGIWHLYLEFDDSGQLSTKIYDKRDDFNFKFA